VGDSQKIVRAFPKPAKVDIGTELMRLRAGEDPIDWRPMPTVGAGVSEIRVQHNGQWRLMYVAKFDEGIYVLHAFRKTTQRTSPADIEVTRNRLRDLIKERRRNG
jgi:phage-related protein